MGQKESKPVLCVDFEQIESMLKTTTQETPSLKDKKCSSCQAFIIGPVVVFPCGCRCRLSGCAFPHIFHQRCLGDGEVNCPFKCATN